MTTERASVLVEVRKYDGRLSGRWSAARLGEDEHGVWLGTPEGTPVSSESGDRAARFAHVVLVPRDAWWMASFCAAPGPEVYCDVCTVPRWSEDGTVLRLVDLDLDVVRPHGGDVHVEDEDEFDEHRVRHGYPDTVVTGARRTCAWLTRAVRRDDGTEPFTSAYRPWLALIT
ncbi:DUF402 domain-containing protein [Streptomyces sp. NPDC056749]|uniref:DUF402 domain-containing protein n=1 Tax=Streptomyces sp. NPDC056749 TaxID=3345936 RepID=UPI0036CADBC5